MARKARVGKVHGETTPEASPQLPEPTPPPSSPRTPDRWVSADDAAAVCRVVDSSVLDLWRVIDTLGRIHPNEQRFYRVTIFGSARLRIGDPVYNDVRRLATELARMGCDIVTGGGPGLMQAANEGEKMGDEQNRTRSYGLRVDLTFEQETNPFVERAFQHGTFFSRLHHFVRLSSAYVVVPGGIGTTLELMMVWQLLQVRYLHGTPLILVGSMWKEMVQWANKCVLATDPPLANPEDLAIPTCVETMDEAIEIIRVHRASNRTSDNAPFHRQTDTKATRDVI